MIENSKLTETSFARARRWAPPRALGRLREENAWAFDNARPASATGALAAGSKAAEAAASSAAAASSTVVAAGGGDGEATEEKEA